MLHRQLQFLAGQLILQFTLQQQLLGSCCFKKTGKTVFFQFLIEERKPFACGKFPDGNSLVKVTAKYSEKKWLNKVV